MPPRRRFPWFRLLTTIALHAGLLVAGNYEYQARQRNLKADAFLRNGDIAAATQRYQQTVETFPLSYSMLRARSFVLEDQTAAAPAAEPPTWLQRNTLDEVDPYRYNQLPLVAWPAVVAALLVVFATRLPRRRGVAFFGLLLALPTAFIAWQLWQPALAAAGLEPAWTGHIPTDWITLRDRQWYYVSYGAIALACLMMLTPFAKARSQLARRTAKHTEPSGKAAVVPTVEALSRSGGEPASPEGT